jgi:hypothetical protein
MSGIDFAAVHAAKAQRHAGLMAALTEQPASEPEPVPVTFDVGAGRSGESTPSPSERQAADMIATGEWRPSPQS